MPLRDALTAREVVDRLPPSAHGPLSTALTEMAEVIRDELESIVEHPDGFHWIAPDGKQQFGPFETREQAVADRDRLNELALQPGQTLHEAERDIGIAPWIDPDTGEPAQGQSPPYIEEE